MNSSWANISILSGLHCFLEVLGETISVPSPVSGGYPRSLAAGLCLHFLAQGPEQQREWSQDNPVISLPTLFTFKDPVIPLGSAIIQDHLPMLKILNLIPSAQFPLPCKVTHSQVLGSR